MKSYFVCSLCHNGILGGGLILDDSTLTYKTGKVTVDPKYRNLVLKRKDIISLTWKWIVFPMAAFEMRNGETYRFLIFNKNRFMKIYSQSASPQEN